MSQINEKTFEPVKNHLKKLSLSNNKLRTLNVNSLSILTNLSEIDLSGNKWLCDKNILKSRIIGFLIKLSLVSDWIRIQYSNAAKTSRSFFLSNAGNTLCERPYTLQGKSIMDLKSTDVNDYNEKLDTTTIALILENTTEAAVAETTTSIDFSKVIEWYIVKKI